MKYEMCDRNQHTLWSETEFYIIGDGVVYGVSITDTFHAADLFNMDNKGWFSEYTFVS